MTKEYILAQLNKLHRTDPWVNEIFAASGLTLDAVADLILGLYNSNWFDLLNERWVKYYETKMGITPTVSQTLEDRCSAIQAKWKSGGKIDLALIQAVCDSWQNGEVSAAFTDGIIQLTFNSTYGVPSDLQTLLNAVDDVKPAHLALAYVLKYLLISDVQAMTLTEMDATPLNHFAGGGN